METKNNYPVMKRIKGTINNIIDDYNSGHTIQGYCNIYEKYTTKLI
jgi:hypothetical protein